MKTESKLERLKCKEAKPKWRDQANSLVSHSFGMLAVRFCVCNQPQLVPIGPLWLRTEKAK